MVFLWFSYDYPVFLWLFRPQNHHPVIVPGLGRDQSTELVAQALLHVDVLKRAARVVTDFGSL